MKIVLLRTPAFLSPIIKKIFEATNSSQKSLKRKNKGNSAK